MIGLKGRGTTWRAWVGELPCRGPEQACTPCRPDSTHDPDIAGIPGLRITVLNLDRPRPPRPASHPSPGHDLPVDHPGPHVGGVHAQDCALRRVDDGRGQHRPKHAAVAAGQGLGAGAGEVRGPWQQPPHIEGTEVRAAAHCGLRPPFPSGICNCCQLHAGCKCCRQRRTRAHLIVKVPPAISSMDSVPSRALRPKSLMVCRGWEGGTCDGLLSSLRHQPEGAEAYAASHPSHAAETCRLAAPHVTTRGLPGSSHLPLPAAAQRRAAQPACAAHLLHVSKAHPVHIAQHRHHQALGRGHCNRDVVVVAAATRGWWEPRDVRAKRQGVMWDNTGM